MKKFSQLLILLAVLAGISLPAFAEKVQKWVDDEGVTHYSDQKPSAGKSDVKEVEIPEDAVSGYDSQEVKQRLDSVIRQMEQDRLIREQELAAQKRAREAEKEAERKRQLEEEKNKPIEGIPAASKEYRRLMKRKLELEKLESGTTNQTGE